MNKYQRVAIGFGIILIIIIGLFPSYRGEVKYSNSIYQVQLGHYFIFSAPEAYDVTLVAKASERYCKAVMNLSEVLILMLVVFISTVGIVLILSRRKD